MTVYPVAALLGLGVMMRVLQVGLKLELEERNVRVST